MDDGDLLRPKLAKPKPGHLLWPLVTIYSEVRKRRSIRTSLHHDRPRMSHPDSVSSQGVAECMAEKSMRQKSMDLSGHGDLFKDLRE